MESDWREEMAKGASVAEAGVPKRARRRAVDVLEERLRAGGFKDDLIAAIVAAYRSRPPGPDRVTLEVQGPGKTPSPTVYLNAAVLASAWPQLRVGDQIEVKVMERRGVKGLILRLVDQPALV